MLRSYLLNANPPHANPLHRACVTVSVGPQQRELGDHGPASPSGTFAELHARCARDGLLDRLPQLCEEQAAADRDATAAELLYRAARLYHERGDAVSEARVLTKVLAADPEHVEALARLQVLAAEQRRWSEQVDLLQRWVRVETARGGTPATLAEIHRQLAETAEVRLDAWDIALEHYRAAVDLNAAEPKVLAACRRLQARLGDWAAVESLYLAEIAATADPAARGVLYRELAQLRARGGSDLAGAAEALRALLELNPDDEPALEQLGEVYTAAQIADPERAQQAAAVYVDLAQRCKARGENSRTVAFLRRVLGVDPQQLEAYRALRDHFEHQERWRDLERLYFHRSLVADEDERISLALERGALLETRLNDVAAAESCYESVIEVQLPAGPAIERLRELYRARQAWDRLSTLLWAVIERSEQVAAKVEALLELAAIQRERPGYSDTAVELLFEVLRIQPDHADALAACEAYCRQQGDLSALDELVRIALRAASSTRGTEPEQVRAHLQHWAGVAELELGDLALAVEVWQPLTAAVPADSQAVAEVSRLRQRLGELEARARELTSELAEATTESDRQRVVRHAARHFGQHRLDPQRAVDLLQQALDDDPSDDELQQLLVVTAARSGDAGRLADAIERRLGAILSREERLLLQQRLGRLYSDRLERPADALRAFDKVLELKTHDAAALQRIRDLCRHSGDLQPLVDALQRQAQRARSPQERAAVVRELATIDEQRGCIAEGVAHWEEILATLPEDQDALEALHRLYRQQGRHADLLEVLKRRMSALSADDGGLRPVRVAMLREIAEVAELDLGRPDEALAALEQLVASYPLDRAALSALIRLHRSVGHFSEVAELLAREIEASDDPRERLELTLDQLTVLEHELHDHARAGVVYDHLVDTLAPGDVEVQRRARHFYRGCGEHARALALAQRELVLLTSGGATSEARVVLAREVASSYRTELADNERSILAYERVVRLVAGDADALAALRELYGETAAFLRLTDLAEPLAAVLSDPAEHQQWWLDLAGVWENHLGRAVDALRCTRRALACAPEGDADLLARISRIAQHYGLWAELLDVLEDERARSATMAKRLDLTLSMASLCVEQLNQPDRAFDLLREAIGIDAHDQRIRPALERTADATGRYAELRLAYRSLVAAEADHQQRRQLVRREAEIAEQKLNQPGVALRVLCGLRIADLSWGVAGDAELETEIERLAAATGDWAPVVRVVQEQLALVPDLMLRWKLLLGLSELFDVRLDDAVRAFEALLRAWLLRPFEGDVEQQLWVLAQRLSERLNGRPYEPVSLFDLVPHREAVVASAVAAAPPTDEATLEIEEIPTLTDAEELLAEEPTEATIELHAAELQYLVPGALPPAVPKLDIKQPPPLTMAGRTSEAGGSLPRALLPEPPSVWGTPWRRLAAVYGAAEIPEPNVTLAAVVRLKAAARMWEEGAKEPQVALQALGEAAVLQPDDEAVFGELERIGATYQLGEQLAALYEHLIDRLREPGLCISVHQRAARLAQRLGNIATVQRHWQVVLDIDPSRSDAEMALREIFEQAEQWHDLAALLSRQIERLTATTDQAQQETRQLELSELFELRLDRPREAAEWLARAVTHRQNDVSLLQRLARLYAQAEQWVRHSHVLEQLAALARDPATRVEYLMQLGVVFEHELELPDRAIDAYRDVVTGGGADEPTLDRALTALASLYEQHHQLDQLLALVRNQLAGADGDPRVSRPLLRHLAAVLQKRDRHDEAAEVLAELQRLSAAATDHLSEL